MLELDLQLATDPVELADTKARLLQNQKTHALFDTDRFCRNLENALARMVPVAP